MTKIPIGKTAIGSQAMIDRVVRATTHVEERQLLGSPSNTFDFDNHEIKLKNSTGGALTRGSVLEIGDYIPTTYNRSHRWFDGTTPSSPKVATAILAEPATSNKVAIAKITGVIEARVNVTDEDHGFASITASSNVLTSQSNGTIRILHKPSGTGELMCWVLLPSQSRTILKAKTVSGIGTRSSATVNIWRNGSVTSPLETVTAHLDWCDGGQGIGADKEIIIALDDEGRWMVIAAECEATTPTTYSTTEADTLYNRIRIFGGYRL